MDTTKAWEAYKQELQPVLKSKVDELILLGYQKVTTEELWNFLIAKKWKRIGNDVRLHRLVNDVLAVKAQAFMSYQTVEAFKSPNLFANIDEDELKELLSQKPSTKP